MHAHLLLLGVLLSSQLEDSCAGIGGRGAEKPLATNAGVQQLLRVCQSVTAFGPDAKHVLGFNLCVRSPIARQSGTAPAGTDAIRWAAANAAHRHPLGQQQAELPTLSLPNGAALSWAGDAAAGDETLCFVHSALPRAQSRHNPAGCVW